MADVADAPAKATGALTKKVGPLPIGVWVILIGGTIVIVYAMNSRGKNNTVNTLEVAADGTTGPESNVGDGSVGGWLYQQSVAVSNKTYTTNEEWGRAAIQFLIGQGYDAALADVAIRRYMGGLDITVQQRPLITAALKGLGPPPEQMGPINEIPGDGPVTGGGGGTPNTPPPTPKPNRGGIFGFVFGLVDLFLPGLKIGANNWKVPVNGMTYDVDLNYGDDGAGVTVTGPGGDETVVGIPRPQNSATQVPVIGTTNRTYIIKTGDTLTSIALAMYGSSLQASKIYNANTEVIANKDNLTPGVTLIIPE